MNIVVLLILISITLLWDILVFKDYTRKNSYLDNIYILKQLFNYLLFCNILFFILFYNGNIERIFVYLTITFICNKIYIAKQIIIAVNDKVKNLNLKKSFYKICLCLLLLCISTISLIATYNINDFLSILLFSLNIILYLTATYSIKNIKNYI